MTIYFTTLTEYINENGRLRPCAFNPNIDMVFSTHEQEAYDKHLLMVQSYTNDKFFNVTKVENNMNTGFPLCTTINVNNVDHDTIYIVETNKRAI